MAASGQLMNELAGFAGLAACAGIRGKWKQARKARGNHHGEYILDSEGNVREIPVRQFVWAATRDRRVTPYSAEIEEVIMRGIHDNPTPHTQKMSMISATGIYKDHGAVVPKSGKHGTPIFAGRKGAYGLMEKIAKQMETNQFNAIETRNIRGKEHNADSTIRRKGFDHPLVWSGDMQMAIEGWVEEL